MHRYEELEKLYYKKKLLKIFSISAFFLAILAIFFIYGNQIVVKKNKKNEKPPIKSVTQNDSKVSKKKSVSKLNKTTTKTTENKKSDIQKQKKSKTVSTTTKDKNSTNVVVDKTNENSLNFILPDTSVIPMPSASNEKSVQKKKNASKIEVKNKTKNKKISSTPAKTVKHKITFHLSETTLTLNKAISQFNTNPSYDLAIIIAQEYYKKGDLNKAQKWALKANNLNPQKPGSWLLFADILLKKGNKQKALEILKIYEQTYGTSQIIENKIRSINE